MKILSRLDDPPFRVSKGDRKIIDCIRAHLTEIPRMTISEIALASGTAEATCPFRAWPRISGSSS